jgi:hypothetical protein
MPQTPAEKLSNQVTPRRQFAIKAKPTGRYWAGKNQWTNRLSGAWGYRTYDEAKAEINRLFRESEQSNYEVV